MTDDKKLERINDILDIESFEDIRNLISYLFHDIIESEDNNCHDADELIEYLKDLNLI